MIYPDPVGNGFIDHGWVNTLLMFLMMMNSFRILVIRKLCSWAKALCSEAATHLQEMKELLISISCELLGNVDDVRSSRQLKKLSQDRLQLNKEVKPLENYLQASWLNEDR
ncbi:hypothetical protein MKW98_027440 [Papaver atlanticum]|uniref:Uncharacterized protein n=1 Tax=Papaver atlanticum TaxID=357466 RepID=A0AAD4TIR4_9MAGN|nr:hypothetical protein MKW98_027440 [Papaver atlanticum]